MLSQKQILRGLTAGRNAGCHPGGAVGHHRQRSVCRSTVLSTETVQLASYAALGLGATSFVTTFFVLPKLYTKNVDWNTMLTALRQDELRSVTPQEAASRSRSWLGQGAVLLDVRLSDTYAELAPAGSINVPLYLPIQNWDFPSIVRRLGFAFFGVPGTELNPEFVQQVQAAVPQGREIIVICESGGSIEEKVGNSSGFQSRSLKAVYYLKQAGFSRVAHVQGGLGQWVREGLPTTSEGEDDGGDPADGGELATSKTGLLSVLAYARQGR